jgi:PIN domain nuclease of toxin-antitoxin system
MSEPVEWVLDASAVLAVIQQEPGAASVEERLSRSGICTVNLSEVAAKLLDAGLPADEAQAELSSLGLTLLPFDATLAWRAAALRPLTRRFGLSLGDRACLATGMVLERPVVSADRKWVEISLPVAVECIR